MGAAGPPFIRNHPCTGPTWLYWLSLHIFCASLKTSALLQSGTHSNSQGSISHQPDLVLKKPSKPKMLSFLASPQVDCFRFPTQDRNRRFTEAGPNVHFTWGRNAHQRGEGGGSASLALIAWGGGARSKQKMLSFSTSVQGYHFWP
jgi:hypothetical protein